MMSNEIGNYHYSRNVAYVKKSIVKFIKSSIMKMTHYFLIIIVLFLTSCTCNNHQKSSQQTQANVPFVNPPFKDVIIPFAEYSFLAEDGDTIFYKTGSIILIPPNALVDINGNLITGEVKITYREFSDPIDFFISGIPMEYDSVNTEYILESSGMCEINAYKDNVPVYVNPKIKPEINFATKNNNASHNLYFLDTIQKNWNNKGKDIITILDTQPNTQADKETAIRYISTPPTKPIKATGENPVFSIVIEPGSAPELQAYNNLKFEIDKDEKNYSPKDGDIEWEDVKIEKGNKAGTYIVSFIKEKRKVSYITRPVFEGKDYDEALKVFEKKDKEYHQLLASRLTKEKNEKRIKAMQSQNEKIQEENEKIAKLNLLIEARNKQIEEYNKQQKEKEKSLPINTLIIRTFQIDGFGIWNTDEPILKQGIHLLAKFKDKSGKQIVLDNITVVYKGFNGICRYFDANIITNPNSDNMIWSVLDGKFVYLTYDEFNNCKINTNTKEFTFEMNVYPDKITSSEDLKKVVGF